MSDSKDGSRPKIHLGETSELVIHTGNTIGEFKRKTASSATEELIECMETTLTQWANQIGSEELLSGNVLHCYNQKDSVKIGIDERKDIKLSVKILLGDLDPNALQDAVQSVLDELDVTTFESVIMAFPPMEEKLTLDRIKPLWMALEKLVTSNLILTIGISDLETEMLIELFNWAKIKPSANQVNLASCCIIPPEMQEFAKENDILLLTHNDPKEILPIEQLNQLLLRTLSFPAGVLWKPLWIARYSALVKCRGVIQNKGFISYLRQK